MVTKYHYDPLKGANSTKGDNTYLKKYMSIFFDEESIYEISKLHLNFERTEGRTDKPKAISPFNFSKAGRITTVHTKSEQKGNYSGVKRLANLQGTYIAHLVLWKRYFHRILVDISFHGSLTGRGRKTVTWSN